MLFCHTSAPRSSILVAATAGEAGARAGPGHGQRGGRGGGKPTAEPRRPRGGAERAIPTGAGEEAGAGGDGRARARPLGSGGAPRRLDRARPGRGPKHAARRARARAGRAQKWVPDLAGDDGGGSAFVCVCVGAQGWG